MQVFTVRPRDRGTRRLLAALRAAGADAFNLAPQRLVACPAPDVGRRIEDLGDASHWLFTSPAAVRIAARQDDRSGLALFAPAGSLARAGAAGRVFAPGPGTAAELLHLGIAPTVPDQRYDSEGLLALPALGEPLEGHVVIVGAPDGRGLLAPSLRERGAKVTLLHVYARVSQPLPRRELARLCGTDCPLLVASSGALLDALLAQLDTRRRQRLASRSAMVVASGRLATQAREAGFTDVTTATSARPEDLLEAVHARAAAVRAPA